MYQLSLAHKKAIYLDQIYEIYLQNDNCIYFGDSAPVSQEDFEANIQDCDYNPTFVLVNDEDEVAAFCQTDLKKYNRYTQLSLIIAKQFEEKSLEIDFVKLIIEQLTKLNLTDYLEIHTYQSNSQNNMHKHYSQPEIETVVRQFGFSKVGTYPNWIKLFKDGYYLDLDETIYILKLNNKTN
jgi:hypothetical protein